MANDLRLNYPSELRYAATGGIDGEGAGSGPLVVLCHGFGAPGEDLVPLGRALRRTAPQTSPPVRFVFPAAPIDLRAYFGADARAWWFVDLEARMRRIERGEPRDPDEVPDGYDDAVGLLVKTVEALRGDGPLLLGGFSQGAMTALATALRLSRPPEGLALLSSTPIARARQTQELHRLRTTRIFQSHGRQDVVLPFGDAKALEVWLRAADLQVEFAAFEGGHEIPVAALQGLRELMDRTFSGG
jgi:phospholipase/carboxylesterase